MLNSDSLARPDKQYILTTARKGVLLLQSISSISLKPETYSTKALALSTSGVCVIADN